MAVDDWGIDGTGEPWQTFVSARLALGRGDQTGAIELWRSVVSMEGLESRHYLQAWHFLRGNGVSPPADVAKRVYGVVIEHWVDTGFDLVAAYADGHARYLNHAGGGVVWERPDDSLDDLIDDVVSAGQDVAAVIGPWDGAEPPAPPQPNQVRINILTPSGLHFGSGSVEDTYGQPLAKEILASGATLMVGLIDKSHNR